MVSLPLFMPGTPGGMELLVVLLMMVFGFVLPPAIAVLLYRRFPGSEEVDEKRVARLEREVAELRGRVDEPRTERE